MKKLRYMAYDFQMEDLAKFIFEKRGRVLVPAFEHGRILLKEGETDNEQMRRAELYILQRPFDEEVMAYLAHRVGFDKIMLDAAFGDVSIARKIGDNKKAKFNIGVNMNERSKGYGTVLMNAGAKYCRDVQVEKLVGTLLVDQDIKRRVAFYQQLGAHAYMGEEHISADVKNPELNEIKFTTNRLAEEVWNSK